MYGHLQVFFAGVLAQKFGLKLELLNRNWEVMCEPETLSQVVRQERRTALLSGAKIEGNLFASDFSQKWKPGQ